MRARGILRNHQPVSRACTARDVMSFPPAKPSTVDLKGNDMTNIILNNSSTTILRCGYAAAGDEAHARGRDRAVARHARADARPDSDHAQTASGSSPAGSYVGADAPGVAQRDRRLGQRLCGGRSADRAAFTSCRMIESLDRGEDELRTLLNASAARTSCAVSGSRSRGSGVHDRRAARA